jgi:hypothetical protein
LEAGRGADVTVDAGFSVGAALFDADEVADVVIDADCALATLEDCDVALGGFAGGLACPSKLATSQLMVASANSAITSKIRAFDMVLLRVISWLTVGAIILGFDFCRKLH